MDQQTYLFYFNSALLVWAIFRKVIRTIEPSDYRAFGLLDFRTIGLSDLRTYKRVGLLCEWSYNEVGLWLEWSNKRWTTVIIAHSPMLSSDDVPMYILESNLSIYK